VSPLFEKISPTVEPQKTGSDEEDPTEEQVQVESGSPPVADEWWRRTDEQQRSQWKDETGSDAQIRPKTEDDATHHRVQNGEDCRYPRSRLVRAISLKKALFVDHTDARNGHISQFRRMRLNSPYRTDGGRIFQVFFIQFWVRLDETTVPFCPPDGSVSVLLDHGGRSTVL